MRGLVTTLCAGAAIVHSTLLPGAVVDAWVQRYSSGLGSAEDSVAKVVTDSAGNVVVAGRSDNGLTGDDLLIMKYSAANGSLLWQQRYDGPDNRSDTPTGLALDASGNVIVAGSSVSRVTGADFFTAKFAAGDGTLIWQQRFNGAGDDSDGAAAVAIDHNGDVVVTGSTGAGHSYDFYTAKYAGADGTLLWERHYDSGSNRDDFPIAVAIDSQGDAVVTGASGNDIYTVKYRAADGAVLWERRFNSPLAGGPQAMAMAPNGDVVVAGLTTSWIAPDFYTARYAAATGIVLWERVYNGPANAYDQAHAVAIDAKGDVFVTGRSYSHAGQFDFFTIKYAGVGGATLWTNRTDGPAHDSDFPNAIVLDDVGNLLVTGESLGPSGRFDLLTVKYAGTNGATLWAHRYNGPSRNNDAGLGITVDSRADVIVTGVSPGTNGSYDFYTVKYASTNGAPLWEQRYDGPFENYDAATAAAIGPDGSVFVTGTSPTASSGPDAYTIKYAADGTMRWAQRYNGGGQWPDTGNSVAVDLHGNVAITGAAGNTNGGVDIYTAKYAGGTGALIWDKRYDGPEQSYDAGQVVRASVEGDVIVAGQSFSRGRDGEGSPDFYTAKYSAGNGALLWERRYAGPADADFLADMQLDGNGNVVVTGSSGDESGDLNFYTAKYAAADGALLWERRYNGPASYTDIANAVALDRGGNVFVTGHSTSSRTNFYSDIYTAKYDGATGDLLWEVRYNGPGDLGDEGLAVATDATGNAVITGYSYAQDGGQDIYTAKYRSTDGALLWEHRYRGWIGSGENVGLAVAVDELSNPIVTGYAFNGTNTDYYTAKYAVTDGVLLWERRYNGPLVGADYPAFHGLAVAPGGTIVVTGVSDRDFATVVYRDSPGPVIHCPTNIVVDFSGNNGAVVRFDVTANAPLVVTCIPPSGSRFSIGETMVSCVASDGNGSSVSCAFTVTVRGARGVLADVRDGLIGIRNGVTESGIARRLDKAIAQLTEVLSGAYWRDETHLDEQSGEGVFRGAHQAISLLCSAGAEGKQDRPNGDYAAEMDRILKAERLLASVAIREGIQNGIPAKNLEQARRFLAKGDAFSKNGVCGAGSIEYRNAWKAATRNEAL